MKRLDLIDERMERLIKTYVNVDDPKPFKRLYVDEMERSFWLNLEIEYTSTTYTGVKMKTIRDYLEWDTKPNSFEEEIEYIKSKYGEYFDEEKRDQKENR